MLFLEAGEGWFKKRASLKCLPGKFSWSFLFFLTWKNTKIFVCHLFHQFLLGSKQKNSNKCEFLRREKWIYYFHWNFPSLFFSLKFDERKKKLTFNSYFFISNFVFSNFSSNNSSTFFFLFTVVHDSHSLHLQSMDEKWNQVPG